MNSTAMKCVVTITSLGHITMSIYVPTLHNLSIIVRIDVCPNDDKKNSTDLSSVHTDSSSDYSVLILQINFRENHVFGPST